MRAQEIENRKMDAKKRSSPRGTRPRREGARPARRRRQPSCASAPRARPRGRRRGTAPAAAAPAAAARKASSATPAPARSSARVPAGTYIAPVRARIGEEPVKVMPMITQSDLTGLDYWALYTMHSRICKYGDDPESMARKFVKGYKKAKK